MLRVLFAVASLLVAAGAQNGAEFLNVIEDDDGGSGALPAPMPAPDAPAGFDEQSVQEVTLLSVAAKHFSAAHSRMSSDANGPRERMRLHRWSHYWRVYEELLRPIRHKPGAVFVEVGAGGGGSAQVWADWLGPEVSVHIVDIDDMTKVMRGVPVTTWRADQSNVSFWRETFFPAVGKIDALIDDGGHSFQQQIVTLREALPWVKPGGVLSVEDAHTSFGYPQWCGSFHEVDIVKAELRRALDRGMTASDVARGMPAWATPESRGTSVQALAEELVGGRAPQSRCQDDSTSRVLPPWSFMDEAKTLVTDLHAWWFDPALPAPEGCTADGVFISQAILESPSPPMFAENLHRARTMRGSLLGRAWRRWFTRNVASIRFLDSMVVVQRWWHPHGRAASLSTNAGSVAALSAIKQQFPPGHHLTTAPPEDQTIVPDEATRAAMGPHFTRLIDSVAQRQR